VIDWIAIIIGIVIGAVLAWLIMRPLIRAGYERGVREGDAERARLEERLAQQERYMQEKLASLEQDQARLTESFKALSAEALKSNNQSFLDLAKTTLEKFQQGARDDLTARQKSIEQLAQPIRERLEKFDGKLDELEKARIGAYRALDQQLKSLLEVHLPQLHSETAGLVKALRQPTTRGRWGEVQLRRVVEMAGMLEHCDFMEQETVNTETGQLRPDMVVRLPGGRQIVVDSKTPVDAYLSAVEADNDEARKNYLTQHARQVRDHINALGKKSYFEQFDPTPEFVVMFVPGEAFFSSALTDDPSLIERGAEQRVIPASPTTLIALLKAIAYGWRQEALAQNAAEVAALGNELYDRINSLAGHWQDVGKRLGQTIKAYNESIGTLESRVLVSTRKFQELKVAPAHKEIDRLVPIEQSPRPLTAPEMTGQDNETALPAENPENKN